jgi:hypothetical protein
MIGSVDQPESLKGSGGPYPGEQKAKWDPYRLFSITYKLNPPGHRAMSFVFFAGNWKNVWGFETLQGVLDHCRLFAFSFVGAIALKTLGLYFAMRKNMQKFACVKFDTEFSLRRKPKERGTYPFTRLFSFQ